jgi:hypothetical protein
VGKRGRHTRRSRRPTAREQPDLAATYDTEPRTIGGEAVSSESDEKIRQQLRLMGYIE